MNNQEAFNKVWQHFIVEKHAPSIVAQGGLFGNSCRYRDGKGNKCAVGCMIPDEMYREEMDTTTGTAYATTAVKTLLERFDDVATLFEGVDIELLATMQDIHDSCAMDRESLFHISMEMSLRTLAENMSLSVPA